MQPIQGKKIIAKEKAASASIVLYKLQLETLEHE